jgi:DNA (cytosine-5)-methyltransferase 1
VALDTFAGEGGMAVGLAMAGLLVVGVETDPARAALYPFPVLRMDAIEAIVRFGHRVALVHGSPTCTGYSRGTAAIPDRFDRYPRLIAATREAMRETGRPYVIENVADARRELVEPVMLCGRMFGLSAMDTDGTPLVMDRHRLFETSWGMEQPEHPKHDRSLQVAGSYGGARRDKDEARHVRKGGYVPASVEVQRQLLGTPWMSERGCWHSIPPVYGLAVGRSYLAAVANGTTEDGDTR